MPPSKKYTPMSLHEILKMMSNFYAPNMTVAYEVLVYMTQEMSSIRVFDYSDPALSTQLLIQEGQSDEYVLTFMANTSGYQIKKIVKSSILNLE